MLSGSSDMPVIPYAYMEENTLWTPERNIRCDQNDTITLPLPFTLSKLMFIIPSFNS